MTSDLKIPVSISIFFNNYSRLMYFLIPDNHNPTSFLIVINIALFFLDVYKEVIFIWTLYPMFIQVPQNLVFQW